MPALVPGDLVLLTDATGVTGTHIVSDLASHGFRVRVAIAKPGDLCLPSGVEIAPVADWTVSGYRATTAGVDGIVLRLGHTEFAVGKVLALLSALPGRLKRIVAISWTGAISTEKWVHSADEWNTAALEDQNKTSLAGVILAEQAFWDHCRSPRTYDAVSLAPGQLIGPGLPGPLERWMRPCADALETAYGNMLDVRDLAAFVVRALSIQAAAGERVVLSAGPVFGNDMAIIATGSSHQAVHRYLKHPSLQRGNPDPGFRGALAVHRCTLEARNVLRRDTRELDVTLADAVRSVMQCRQRKNGERIGDESPKRVK